jgi:fused signal recognition particle receptor
MNYRSRCKNKMFGFLKDKLKDALGKLSKEVEKDATVEKKEIIVDTKYAKDDREEVIDNVKTVKLPAEKKKGFFQKIFGKKEEEDIIEDKELLREKAESSDTETTFEDVDEGTPTQILETQKEIEDVEEKTEDFEDEEAVKVKAEVVEIKTEEIKVPTPEIKSHEKKIIASIEPDIKSAVPVVKSIEHATKIQPTKFSEPNEHKIPPKVPDIQPKKASVPVPEVHKPHHQEIEEERQKKTVEHKEEEHKGFFTKITETFTKINITEEKFEELFWDLEVVLLENNVAVEVIDKIKRDLKKELMSGKVSRSGVEELIISTLRHSITELFDVEKIDLIGRIKDRKKEGKPYIIAIIGVNGSGKTTSIAKLTHKFQKEGLSVVLAASDTFRAAAIQQLEEHANNLNVKMVKHDYNSDPAAVAFDTIKYAEAKKIDVVLIDTAGRLHSNTNLMRELEKVIRVCKPDIKIFVGESITGNDCVEQAKEFDKAVGIDAIILAKADVDDKGGAAISVSYILQRPILYLGVGQTYDDLREFDSNVIIKSLEL